MICGVILTCHPAAAYRLGPRWTNTASGAAGAQGSSITLTWSIAPDGAPIDQLGSSDLISFMDATHGVGPGGPDLTQRPWFRFFADSFQRWSDLGGVTYVYEPADDGLNLGGFPGLLGVRGDIRLGGALIDGSGGILGFNHFPNDGDMVLDTGEVVAFANPQGDYLELRNVVMHEHGHGLGLSHVASNDAAFLMEPFYDISFDGPQLDDIRGLHRAYGDALEKSHAGQGNNSAMHATPFGTLLSGVTIARGADAGLGTVVAHEDTDFLSIDDNSDIDYFSFDLAVPGTLDVTLTPLGPTYLEGPRFGPQQPLDSAAVSDLGLTILGTDGLAILQTANQFGPGFPEQISGLELPTPGRYFARVNGLADDVQLYRLDVTAQMVPEPVWLGAILAAWFLAIARNR